MKKILILPTLFLFTSFTFAQKFKVKAVPNDKKNFELRQKVNEKSFSVESKSTKKSDTIKGDTLKRRSAQVQINTRNKF